MKFKIILVLTGVAIVVSQTPAKAGLLSGLMNKAKSVVGKVLG